MSELPGGVEGRDDVQHGDVVVVDYVEYYEFQKFEQGRCLIRSLPLDHPSLYLRENFAEPLGVDEAWRQGIDVDRPEQGLPKVVIGNLASGDKLMGDSDNDFQRKVVATFDKVIAVDMESTGLARSMFKSRKSVHYNPQYAVIRGISDVISDADNDELRRIWRPYASEVAATFAKGMVRRLLELR